MLTAAEFEKGWKRAERSELRKHDRQVRKIRGLQSDLAEYHDVLKICKQGDVESLQKAWSDKAREAAAAARHHNVMAASHDHKEIAAAAEGDYTKASAHSDASAAHRVAAGHYTRASEMYGRSKLKTFALGGGFGMAVRAIRQSRAMRAGRAAGEHAQGLSVKTGGGR